MEGSYDGKNSHLVAFFIVRAALKEAFLPLPYRVQMAQYGLRFVWYDLSLQGGLPSVMTTSDVQSAFLSQAIRWAIDRTNKSWYLHNV